MWDGFPWGLSVDVEITRIQQETVLAGRLNRTQAGVLVAGKLVNDTYVSFLSPLLPILIAKFGLSMTFAALLSSTLSVSSMIAQPVFGYLADRWATRAFVVLGPLVTASFMSALGLAPDYATLILFVILGGLGTAAFNPQAFAMISRAFGTHRNLGTSILMIGGTVGRGIGPLLVIAAVYTLGLDRTVLTAVPALVIALALYRLSPSNVTKSKSSDSVTGAVFRSQLRPIFLLWAIMALRAVTIGSFNTFLAVFLVQKGLPVSVAGVSVSIVLFSGVVGLLLGGSVSEKLSERVIISISLIGATPFLLAFVHAPLPVALLFLALANVLLFASQPINVAMGQALVPSSPSTVSGIMVGLGWGAGGLLVTAAGMLADAFGIASALQIIACIPLVGILCVLALPWAKTRLRPSHP